MRRSDIYNGKDKNGNDTLTHTGGTLIQDGNRTYMSDATLDEKVTISSGKTMKIGKNATVTIEKNGELKIENGATLKIEDGAKLYVDGTVDGNITGAGKIYYKLNYDLDGGEWKNGYKPEDYYLSGAAFDLPTEENLKKAGYTLSGWTEKGEKDVVWKIPATATGIKNVVAQWTANTYTVTIKDDKDGKVIESQQIPEGGLAKKPAKEPVREGYTFIGWQANGAAWDFDQNVVERDTEIIALWEKVVIAPDVAIEGGHVVYRRQGDGKRDGDHRPQCARFRRGESGLCGCGRKEAGREGLRRENRVGQAERARGVSQYAFRPASIR